MCSQLTPFYPPFTTASFARICEFAEEKHKSVRDEPPGEQIFFGKSWLASHGKSFRESKYPRRAAFVFRCLIFGYQRTRRGKVVLYIAPARCAFMNVKAQRFECVLKFLMKIEEKNFQNEKIVASRAALF